MSVEDSTTQAMWESLRQGEPPPTSQRYARPVPGFRDVAYRNNAPALVQGTEALLPPKQPGLSLSISELPLVIQWLQDPTLPNAKRMRREEQLRNESPQNQAGGRRGTLNHVLYSALQAKIWNQSQGKSADELIPAVFPTLKPDEKVMYQHLIGTTPEISSTTPYVEVAQALKAAYEKWLEKQAEVERVKNSSAGWQQASFLGVPTEVTNPWQLRFNDFKSDAFQATIKALLAACGQPPQCDVGEEPKGVPAGMMLEAMVLDNQKKALDTSAGVGSLQVKSRFDQVNFWRDPKTGAITVSLLDLKTGKKELAGNDETTQMLAMAHVLNRFADGLVVAHQAAAGHRQMPAGFAQDEKLFRLTRAIDDADWQGGRVQRVVRRWLDRDNQVFVDHPVEVNQSTIGAFGELYGELIEHVGKQKPVLNVLLGRKSAKK